MSASTPEPPEDAPREGPTPSDLGPEGWLPVVTDDGSVTLAHGGHGQTCHSRAGAWLEALERYARPCRLAELAARRVATGEPSGVPEPGSEHAPADGRGADRVRLLDVGSGLGWNLAAALAEVRSGGGRLAAVGLELERGVTERAGEVLERSGSGPWSAAMGDLVAALEGRPPEDLELALHFGDARQALEQLDPGQRFDAIFLDAFSPGVEPDLWQPDFLAALAARLAPGGLLSTYTVAMRVRVGLARAGLEVGRGPRVGAKLAGTLAVRRPGGPGLEPLEERDAIKLTRRLAEP